MTGMKFLRLLPVMGTLAIWVGGASSAALGQTQDDGPAAVGNEISERDAIVDLLKARLKTRPADLLRAFNSIAVTDLFFPGDVAPFKADKGFDRLGQYPRDVQNVEKWYLEQIPDLYEEVPRPHDSKIRVLYLPRCNDVTAPDADTLFPGEGARSNAISAGQVLQAQVELALEQQGVSLDDIGRGRIADATDWNATAKQLRALNIRLLADDESQDGEPLLVLKGYCGRPTEAATFPGVFFPPEPPPSPPPPPMYEEPRYYMVKMPAGVASVKIGSGFQAIVCKARKIPLHDSRCLWESAKDNMPIRFDVLGRHVFTARQGATWVTGSFPLSVDKTYQHPLPPLPPETDYSSMGIQVIQLIPDP